MKSIMENPQNRQDIQKGKEVGKKYFFLYSNGSLQKCLPYMPDWTKIEPELRQI